MRNNNRITKLLIHTDIQLFTLHLIGIYFHLNISLLNIDNKYILLKSMGYDLQNVVLYENEEDSSLEANANGINKEKIIKVEF